jgi:hypothetical protein
LLKKAVALEDGGVDWIRSVHLFRCGSDGWVDSIFYAVHLFMVGRMECWSEWMDAVVSECSDGRMMMHKGTMMRWVAAAGGRIARREHIRTVLERERLTGTLTNAGVHQTSFHWPWPYPGCDGD